MTPIMALFAALGAGLMPEYNPIEQRSIAKQPTEKELNARQLAEQNTIERAKLKRERKQAQKHQNTYGKQTKN